MTCRAQVTAVQAEVIKVTDDLTRCKRRLEHADVYGEIYRLNQHRYPTRILRGRMPIMPRERGPVEMPILAEDTAGPIRNQRARRSKKNKPRMRCYTCNKRGHCSYECPQKQPKEEGEVTETSMREERMKLMDRIDWTPTVCTKCGVVDPRHTVLECPKYERCRRCRGSGAYGFMRRHECRPIVDDEEVLLVDDTDYDLYWDPYE